MVFSSISSCKSSFLGTLFRVLKRQAGGNIIKWHHFHISSLKLHKSQQLFFCSSLGKLKASWALSSLLSTNTYSESISDLTFSPEFSKSLKKKKSDFHCHKLMGVIIKLSITSVCFFWAASTFCLQSVLFRTSWDLQNIFFSSLGMEGGKDLWLKGIDTICLYWAKREHKLVLHLGDEKVSAPGGHGMGCPGPPAGWSQSKGEDSLGLCLLNPWPPV